MAVQELVQIVWIRSVFITFVLFAEITPDLQRSRPITVATTQVDDPAQMYAMAVSEANSCKNRLLKNYKSNEETLQHTYVMVLMVLQQSQSKKTYEIRINCTRVL